MNSDNRPFLPSENRIAAAASLGLFPRSILLVQGSVFIVSGIFIYFTARNFVTFFKDKIESILTSFNTDQNPVYLFKTLFSSMFLLLIAIFIVAVITGVIPAIIAKKKRGETRAKLPEKIPVMFDSIAIGFLLSLAIIAFAVFLVRNFEFTFEMFETNSLVAADQIVKFIALLLVGSGCFFMFGGFIQLLLYKQRLISELSLFSQEAKKEQRIIEGPGKKLRSDNANINN